MTTPTLADVIRAGVDRALVETHTAMPAEVISYDAATGLATVQPSLKRRYRNSDVVSLPQIRNVPVCYPRAAGGAAFVHLPLAKGDPVLLVFAERSVDRWKSRGGEVDPADLRMHDLSDAFAIPGGYPKSKPLAGVAPGDLVVGNGTTRVTLKPSGNVEFAVGAGLAAKLDATGKVSFTNLATGELLAALVQILTTAQAGGFPLIIDPTALAVLQSMKA